MNRIRSLAAAALLLTTSTVAVAADGTTDVAVIVYRSTDVECHGARYTAALTDAQLAQIASEVVDFEAKAEGWTATDVVVTVEIREQLTAVTPTGRGLDCWPTAPDTNPPTAFDGVLIVWHPGPCDSEILPSCAYHRAGIAYVGTTLGFSYGTVAGNVGSAYQSTSTLSNVLLHEFLHGYVDGEPPTEFPLPAAPSVEQPTPAPTAAPQRPASAAPPTPAPVTLPDTAMAP